MVVLSNPGMFGQPVGLRLISDGNSTVLTGVKGHRRRIVRSRPIWRGFIFHHVSVLDHMYTYVCDRVLLLCDLVLLCAVPSLWLTSWPHGSRLSRR